MCKEYGSAKDYGTFGNSNFQSPLLEQGVMKEMSEKRPF